MESGKLPEQNNSLIMEEGSAEVLGAALERSSACNKQVVAISNHSLPQNEGDLQLCISDADFVRQVVEELIEKIPHESASSAQEPEIRNVTIHTEHSPGEQSPEESYQKFLDTVSDTDITEYESAADTEPSDPLVSTGSLFTLSDCRAGDTFSSCSTPDDCAKPLSDISTCGQTPAVVESECNISFGISVLCQGLNNLALDTPKRPIYSENQFSLPENQRTDFISSHSFVQELEKVKNVLPEDNAPLQVNLGNIVDDNSFSTSSNTDSFLVDNVTGTVDKSFTKENVDSALCDDSSRTKVAPNNSNTLIIAESSINEGKELDACIESTDLPVYKEVVIVDEGSDTQGKELDTCTVSPSLGECEVNLIDGKKSDANCSEIKLENITGGGGGGGEIVADSEFRKSSVCEDSNIGHQNLELESGSINSGSIEDKGKDPDIIDQSTTLSVCESKFDVDKEPILPAPQEEFFVLAAEASKIAEVITNSFEDLDEICLDEIQVKMSSDTDVNSDVMESGSPKMKSNHDSETDGSQYVINHDLMDSGTTQLTSHVLEEDCLEKTSTPRRRNTCRTPIKKMNGNEMSPKASDELKLKGSDTSHETSDKPAENSDVFNDPASFDFLSSLGNVKSSRDLRKESLYTKFDPLVGAHSPAHSAVSRLESVDSVALDRSTDEYPLSSRDESKNNALDFLDKLIFLTPVADSGKPCFAANDSCQLDHTLEKEKSLIKEPGDFIQDSNRSKLHDEKAEQAAPEELQHLRNLILQQEEDHKVEVNNYHMRIKNLEERLQLLSQQITQNTQGEQEMSLILEEYEKTISRLVAEKEHERQAFDSEKETMTQEKDTISGHLSNIEIAFSDVHQKYERSKQVIQGFKNNEEALRASVNEYEAALKKQEQKYELLKVHAMAQLESANQELVTMRKNHEAENSKLTAMLRKAEVKIHSLEESLEQKAKENQELMNICDELIGKVGNCD